jgi:hypothetical protein
LLAILTEDAGHPDLFTNDSFHRCSVCALVVKETFAVMIAEPGGSFEAIHREANGHTTMSNFNLRLLPTFSFGRRSFSVCGLVPLAGLRNLFSKITASPPVGVFGGRWKYRQ